MSMQPNEITVKLTEINTILASGRNNFVIIEMPKQDCNEWIGGLRRQIRHNGLEFPDSTSSNGKCKFCNELTKTVSPAYVNGCIRRICIDCYLATAKAIVEWVEENPDKLLGDIL